LKRLLQNNVKGVIMKERTLCKFFQKGNDRLLMIVIVVLINKDIETRGHERRKNDSKLNHF